MVRTAALRFRKRIEGMSIRRRLVVLITVPVVCVAAIALPQARDRIDVARTGVEVERTAGHLAQVVALRSAIHRERVAAEAMMQGAAFSLSPEQISQLLGFDVAQTQAEATRQTDDAVAAFADEAPPIDLEALAGVRGQVAGAPADRIAAITAQYEAIDQHLRSVMITTLDQIEAVSTARSRSADLLDAIAAVRAGTDLVDAVNDELRALQRGLFKPGDDTSLVALADARARAAAAGTRLDRLQNAALAQGWHAVAENPEVVHVGRAADAVLRGETPDPELTDGIARIAGISRDGLRGERQIYGYIDAAGRAIRDESATLARRATSELTVTFSLTVALLLLLVVLSIWLSRPVRSLLRRLTDHAEAVSNGRLDVDPIGGGGPRDLATLTAAFDDLVANLRLLENKARALATCNFDAPVLDASVPGALGESLQRSVQVLSGSIVERDELQRHLAHQATHDVLTGLPNRAAATTALEQALRRAHRVGGAVAVLFIDLDEFKPINDVHGHPVGDEVLRTVADRMAAIVRSSDFLARLGGDEFVVVTESAEDAAGVADLADRLIAAASEPITVGDLGVQVGASVGIAFALDANEDAEQLLTCADLAVYRAKQHGRGRAEIYDDHMQEELVARAEIRDALAHAIHNDELYLDYQPVFTAGDSRMCGVEALVRWNRPGVGRVPPDDFIPQAEESPRLIVELDCWVLDRAARQLTAWADDPAMSHLHVAVNISGRHLASRDLVDHVAAVIERHGIDPGHLVLEITETVLLNDLDIAAEQLDRLRAMGIRIAIDDFGTGYTSVTHLARLPVDVLKIDRAFLTDRLDERATTLLAMMIDLGHHLGLAITAEGVETDDQLRVLRDLTCDQTQGFLLGRPQHADRIVEASVAEAGEPVDG